MAGMCCGVNIGETETSAPVEPSSKSARRRRMEIHQFNFVPNDSAVAPPLGDGGKRKRRKMDAVVPVLPPIDCVNAAENCKVQEEEEEKENQLSGEIAPETKSFGLSARRSVSSSELPVTTDCPKFGMTSVCGRRRDMEDAIAIHPNFSGENPNFPNGLHFFGVYDGHGCSHVATRCRDRMHEIVKNEFQNGGSSSWEQTMLHSFSKMDKEVGECCNVGIEADIGIEDNAATEPSAAYFLGLPLFFFPSVPGAATHTRAYFTRMHLPRRGEN